MRKAFLSFLGLFLFLFLTLPVLAVEGTPNLISNREEIQTEATQGAETGTRNTIRQEKREEVREGIQEKIATAQARLTERKKVIVRNHFERVANRLTAVINRFYRLIDRIESRLVKIEEADQEIKTETIRAEIAQVKEKVDMAVDQLETVRNEMNQIIESETPKEGFEQTRKMVGEIRDNLIETHQILVKVIADIKGLGIGNSATPSAEGE